MLGIDLDTYLFNKYLYTHTVYRKNIEEIWAFIKEFPHSCRKTFIKNLKTLKFEKVSLDVMDANFSAYYDIESNTIYYATGESTILNHELAHMASSNKRISGVALSFLEIGDNWTEAISEFIRLSSLGISSSDSDYQFGLFAVQCLVDIYGTKILKPYLKHHPLQFYLQFGKNWMKIMELDSLFETISDNMQLLNQFYEYLSLREVYADVWNDSDLDLFSVDFCGLDFINLNKKKEEYQDVITMDIDFYHYRLIRQENIALYAKLSQKYRSLQKKAMDRVIEIIIQLGLDAKLSKERIKEILIRNLEYKSDAMASIGYGNCKEALIKRWSK